MTVWIFQGNPIRYDVDDYVSRYPELIYWYTPRYSREIALGDLAFIWRARKSSGVIASGKIVELPTPSHSVSHPEALADDLWRRDPPTPDELKTGIALDEIRLTPQENMIPRLTIRDHHLFADSDLILAGNNSGS